MRSAIIKMYDKNVGLLQEAEEGYLFSYDSDYLLLPNAKPVSRTLPLRNLPYKSTILFAFFDGLIPEGWLLDIAERNWKIKQRDRMGLLLACCQDCIGAVSVHEINEEES